MIFPLWQPLGNSSHRLASACGQALGEKATHTGTLDPLAEGVLVILTGKDRLAKGSFAHWHKTYAFSILWGVATDSLDQMGLITQLGKAPRHEKVAKLISQFPSEYDQTLPAFSARRYQGKSGFDWARAGQTIPAKKQSVRLHQLVTVGSESIDAASILNHQQNTVSQIKGNFRQQAILADWSEKITHLHGNMLLTHHQAVVSNRTYIRQLVADIATAVGCSATTWSITRVKNGPYEQEDCLALADLVKTGIS